jgi:arylsulfatase A-like enzyme
MPRRTLAAAFAATLLAASCRRPEAPPSTAIRLVDLYRPVATSAPQAPARADARTEWRFDGAPPRLEKDAATWGWTAFNGVSGLAVRNGRLVGRATSEMPMLHLVRGPGFEEREAIHAIEVRLKVSAGRSLAVELDRSKEIDRDQILDGARHFTWDFTAPIAPGDAQTHTLRSQFSMVTADSRNFFLRPTDAAGATFEIESVRLVTRREHLAGVASGLGWQGLSEVYKETLVARAPEALRFELTLPPRPVLDLAVGTVEDGPVRFRVSVQPDAGEAKELLRRTLTRPLRWEPAPLDLSPWAGRKVTLALAVEADQPGAIGFWGAPVVRSLGAMPAGADADAALPRPQGVILVWADTLRRDHLGAYGYGRPTTPVLDGLAREGVLFDDCVGQATWTKVATPSLFTSLYPTAHGVHDFMDRLPSSALTLAEAYREAGYATLSMSSILFTGRFSNLHQGFEEVHEGTSLPDPNSSKTAREYVDRLLPWLEAHRETPFFVFFHISDPHDPYRPAPPYDTMWADGARSEEHERRGKELRKVIADPLLRNMGSAVPTREDLVKAGLDPEAYVGHDRDWYDGSIRGLDAEMGRLAERLRDMGLDRRTVLVFTGDHGEEFLEHGRMLHGQSVYGELSNMALFFWGPGIVPAGAKVGATVQTIDLMPTLLELSRLPVTPGLQGKSLLPLLAGARPSGPDAVHADAGGWTERPAITEKAVTVDGGSPPPRDTESVSVVFQGYKLIHNTKRPAGRPEFELFDHRKDPLDRTDVAAQHPEVVERLRRELDAWRKTVGAAKLKPDAEAGQALSKEELERLRALGYVQ